VNSRAPEFHFGLVSVGSLLRLLCPALLAAAPLGLAVAALFLLNGGARAQTAGAPERIEWIDVHAHLIGGRGAGRDYEGAVSAALAVMDEAGIRKMVVMPPPQTHTQPSPYDYESFAQPLKRHSARFAFFGGGGSLNVMIHEVAESSGVSDSLRRRFEKRAMEILREGAAGFGEITAHHLSHLSGHPYESAAADHPLLLQLADIAGRNDALIDFHFDLVAEDTKAPEWLATPPNPTVLRANLDGLERLLAHNRNARIVWAHAGSDMLGFWTTALSRRLLAKHPNLFMSLRMGPGRAPQNHPMTRAGEIRPEWLGLLREFPDRFVIGGDQFIASPSVRAAGPGMLFSRRAPMIRERTREFLTALPADLAGKIARENAARLYKLRD
jgi:hypothetical protein